MAQVKPDSPAEKAGLEAGDVIVEWDGQPIADSNDLRIAAARTKPGAKARITFSPRRQAAGSDR